MRRPTKPSEHPKPRGVARESVCKNEPEHGASGSPWIHESIRIAAAFALYLVVNAFWTRSGLHEAYRSTVMGTATLLLPLVQHFPVVSTLENLDLRNMDFVVILTICLLTVSIHIPSRPRAIRFGAAFAALLAMHVVAVLLQSQVTAAQDLLKTADLVLFLPLEFRIVDGCRYFLYDFGMEASTFTLLVLTAVWNSPALVNTFVVVGPEGSRRRSEARAGRRSPGLSPRVALVAACGAGCLVTVLLVWSHFRESNPLHSTTHAHLGDLFLTGGKARQAEAQYRAAIAGGTDDVSAWLNLADMLRQHGMAAEGERILRRGLEAVSDPAGQRRLRDAIDRPKARS